jgi:hypothetical protein
LAIRLADTIKARHGFNRAARQVGGAHCPGVAPGSLVALTPGD